MYRGGVTHCGGEFYAANRTDAELFVEACKNVYLEMLNKGFVTSQGDEFISTIVAHRLKNKVKNAAPYVNRFWTGTFRLISTNYKQNPVVVLHCPAEKEYGMVALYNRFISKGKIPSRKVAHRILHLESSSFITIIKRFIKQILNRCYEH